MPNHQFMPGTWPAASVLDQVLRDRGFRETTITHMAYRQKYAICREYERREARKAAAQMQLALDLKEVKS